VSPFVNKCAQQHFRQVPTTVQIAQHYAWDTSAAKYNARWEPPFDGNQGVIYLNRERPFAQLYRMIVSALNLDNDDSYAVEVIYHGLLVGRTSGCNPPTFSKLPEGIDDLPHVDVAINFAYLEWKHIMRQIPLNKWIWDLRHTREALLFSEGQLNSTRGTTDQELKVSWRVHEWNHHDWDYRIQEWFQNSPGPRPDSRKMRAYIEFRILEADLRSATSQKYGSPTELPGRRGLPCCEIFGMKFRWTPLYDFNGQITFPGANKGSPHLATWVHDLPHFERYEKWWDLPFPCVETTDET
jgi:hypothetical protein